MKKTIRNTILISIFPALGILGIVHTIIALSLLCIYTLMLLLYFIIIMLSKLCIKRGWIDMGARTELKKAQLKKVFKRKASKTLNKNINAKQKAEAKKSVADAKMTVQATSSIKQENKAAKKKDAIDNILN